MTLHPKKKNYNQLKKVMFGILIPHPRFPLKKSEKDSHNFLIDLKKWNEAL